MRVTAAGATGGGVGSFTWTQDAGSIAIHAPVPSGTSPGEVSWNAEKDCVTFGYRGREALQKVVLSHAVIPSESSWELKEVKSKVYAIATLVKARRGHWYALSAADEAQASEVRLNVYDVAPTVNSLLSLFGFGIHHTGVEIYGVEFCFGREEAGLSGVRSGPPRGPIGHLFTKTIVMGRTTLSRQEVLGVLRRMAARWEGKQYHLVELNCNDFSAALCKELLGKSCPEFPAYLNRAARSCCGLLPGLWNDGMDSADKRAFIEQKQRIEGTASTFGGQQ